MILTRDLSDREIVSAMTRNIEGAFLTLARSQPGVRVHESPEVARYLTDIPNPMANIVVRTYLDDETVNARVSEIREDYREHGMPMLWFVNPDSTPERLGDALEAAGGTKVFGAPGMVADLSSMPEMEPLVGIHVSSVEDDLMMEEWTRTLNEVFSLPARVGGMFACLATSQGYGSGASFRNFSAYLDGRHVGTSSLFLLDGVAGIYCVGTRDEARRRGVGAAVTRLAMDEARKQGYRYVILQSSAAGYEVYRRLGFREVCRYERYVFMP